MLDTPSKVQTRRRMEESPCGDTTIMLPNDVQYSEQFKYITSPYYPEPFPGNITCEWTFSSPSPMEFELVDFDGSETCIDESIQFAFGPVDMLRGLPLNIVQRETQVCGSAQNQIISVEGTFDHSFCPYTARVRYHKSYDGGNHKGFMLRYKMIEPFRWNCYNRGMRRSRSTVAIIVGSVAVLIVCTALFLVASRLWARYKKQKQKQESIRTHLIGKWLDHSSREWYTDKFSTFLITPKDFKIKSTPPAYLHLLDAAKGKQQDEAQAHDKLQDTVGDTEELGQSNEDGNATRSGQPEKIQAQRLE
ncbi:hypothetical protein ElyMa_003986900 [Elysia marginata]|uniref:CUB domain-containing protein n=1 Tax=Elysia marginata TaxID=1093978 RepID=A0AAV4G0Q9_9GAST|nr:hypothetical protein ElyMa_003986900 [Elysia marginata]